MSSALRLQNELYDLYKEDKRKLLRFQRIFVDMKKRLEREQVLEALQLINCREQVEEELEKISSEIAQLEERQAQYALIFDV